MANPLCLLPVLLVLLLPCTLTSAAETKGMLFQRLDTNDRLYTDNVLQDVSARSDIKCGMLCAGNDQCKRFTFLRQTICRLFSTKNHTADSWQNEEGVRSFGVVTEPDSCSSDGQCPSGYSLHCSRCLKTVGQYTRPTTAHRLCQDTGGQLVMPKTMAVLTCVWDFIVQQGVGGDCHWLGANDTVTPGNFTWSDGEVLPDDSDMWDTGEPDNTYSGADCVYARLGKLYDYKCSSSNAKYACQTPPLC